MPTAMEFKIGDVVEIVGNHNSHCFKIGQSVTLTHKSEYGGFVGDGNKGRGNLMLQDIAHVKTNSIRFKTKRTALQGNAMEASI